MMQTGYPFEFMGSNKVGADKFLLETLVYVFRSEKSGHSYQVNMEHYVEHLYGVKFFDMSTDNRIGRFSQLTSTYEPRTIFRTVADIAADVCQRDPDASFFFIGAADSRDRSSVSTRRYRVYTAFVNDLNLGDRFSIIELKEQSMSVLINRRAVTDIGTYMQRIIDFVMD
jgi:hypothetical protein